MRPQRLEGHKDESRKMKNVGKLVISGPRGMVRTGTINYHTQKAGFPHRHLSVEVYDFPES